VDTLIKIIDLLSKEEQRNFKIFALRTSEDADRKDVQLFDHIKKVGENYNERKAIRLLYGKTNRPNTFHRLAHRLFQEVGKSVALLHWDQDETISTLHYLTLAMIYRRKHQADIAFHYLRKAERKAESLDLPELLDITLGEIIGLSFENPSIDPEVFIHKRTENRTRLNQLWEIDNVLALVNHRLRLSQNLAKGDQGVMEVLQKTVQELSLNPKIMADPKFRFRMYDAVSKIFLDKRDYEGLEAFVLQTYESFNQEDLFHKGNHDVKLQMLTYIINALFKNDKIQESLDYAERLRIEMDRFGEMLRQKYLFFYYNSLVLNYSATNLDAAIKVLEQMLEIEAIMAVPQYIVFIYLNLALTEYSQKHYKAAIRHLVKLRLKDAEAATDEGFRFRIDIFELALRLELKENETLEYRLPQFRHDYRDFLESPMYEKDRRMVDLIARLNQAQAKVHVRDAQLAQDIEDFLAQFPQDETEIFKYANFLREQVSG
jgi:tetratricopeptide (TPR) repeat protein